MKVSLALFIVAVLISQAVADVYMHHPRGANDRNRERSENRNNANRVYNSQNNAKGGYPWCGDPSKNTPDPQSFAQGHLPIQLTFQHSGGPTADSNALSTIILQTMCTNSQLEQTNGIFRDGTPTGPIIPGDPNAANNGAEGFWRRSFVSAEQQNDDNAGTNTIPIPLTIAPGINGPGPNFNDNSDPGLDNYETSKATLDAFYKQGAAAGARVGLEYAFAETFDYYTQQCLMTQRNMGLYTADQRLGGNSAIFTRQNPNGDRYGLECPEERDYYPWWNPSPWVDLAVYVNDLSQCSYFQQNSFNVAPRYICQLTDAQRQNAPSKLIPIDQNHCIAAGGTWTEVSANGYPAPTCNLLPVSRDNHLGNVQPVDSSGNPQTGTTQMFEIDFMVPDWMVNQQCYLRLRYNMSSLNYPSQNIFTTNFQDSATNRFVDYRFNCPQVTTATSGDVDTQVGGAATPNGGCSGVLESLTFPLRNRPYVYIFPNSTGLPEMGLAINTNQIGRTFQDRSYLLNFIPSNTDPSNTYNLGVRGRRGNIVQCYPAVEYDFVPNNLQIDSTSSVYVTFCNSDFNEANNPNDGEGWQYSDRHNIVQLQDLHADFPVPMTNAENSMFPDQQTAILMAFGGQTNFSQCVAHKSGDTNEQNSYNNCGKLNQSPNQFQTFTTFNAGTFYYTTTRDTNFSNRAQKATLVVNFNYTAGQKAGIAIGVLAGAGAIGAGVFFWVKRRKTGPSTTVAPISQRILSPGSNFFSNAAPKFNFRPSTTSKEAGQA